jgi:hypothetical protein
MNEQQHAEKKLWPVIRRLIPTFIFYAVAIVAIDVLNRLSPGGPCVPGGGALAFFLVIPVIFGLCLYNTFLTFHRGKKNGIQAIIHAAVLVIIFVLFNVG